MSTPPTSRNILQAGIMAIMTPFDRFLDSTNLFNQPLRYYVTGWRINLFFLALALLFPTIIVNLTNFALQPLLVTSITIGVFVLMALGLNVVVGFAGLLDLGYVAFFAIGSYTAAILTGGVIRDIQYKLHLIATYPFWVAVLGGLIIAAFFGVLLGAPTLRLRGDYLAIVTLGFGEIVPILFLNLPYFNKSFGLTAIPPGVLDTPFGSYDFGSYIDKTPFYYLMLVAVVVVIIFVVSLRDSSIGRAWVAIREDEIAAASAGINLVRAKLLAFGVGAMVGGLAGVLNAASLTHVDPGSFVFNISIIVLVMIVLGGIGSVPGVIVGAMILEFFDQQLSPALIAGIENNTAITDPNGALHFLSRFNFQSSQYLLYGLVLVFMILLRPQGLIPNKRRQRELRGIGVAAEELSVVGEVTREELGTDSVGGEE